MGESADFDESGAIAVSLSTTNLTGTGLAKESGGNLDSHTRLLSGTNAGALIGTPGNTVALETAALIASGVTTGAPGGTPLLHGAKQVFQVLNQVIAISGTFTTGNITFTKPGYLIRITAQMSGVNATQPTISVDMQWKINASGSLVAAEELWFLPCGGSAVKRTTGKGPTKGDTLTVAIVNGDAADSVTVSMTIWETTQHVARDDWRSDGAISSLGGGGIAGLANANLLASDNFNVPANGSITKNLPLYAGEARIFVNQNPTAGSTIQLNPGSMFSASFEATFVVIDWNASAHVTTNVTLPRGYCQLIANNSNAAIQPCAVAIMAMEYAS